MGQPTEAAEGYEKELLRQYEVYDRHVDVVSAFEWLFCETRDLPVTVEHFERFPRIPTGTSKPITPDFTVLFKDGTAIVGEIAQIAIHDNSVEKLCQQIGRYDSLDRIPAGAGLSSVSRVDVLLITQLKTGLSAVQRVIEQRMAVEGHPYKPRNAPCIVQYGRDGGTYVFQRIPHPSNGQLARPEGRDPNISDFIDIGLSIVASNFVSIKSSRAFINDPVPPLYLATHLLLKTWPSASDPAPHSEVSIRATAEQLRSQYGVGRVGDVRHALAVLQQAGLARPVDQDVWEVVQRQLGTRGRRDVHEIIAERATREVQPLVRAGGRRQRTPPETQQPLFNLPD